MTPPNRVLLVGWAGADWSLVHPLLDAGDLPHLERLVNEGCMGRIGSLQPHVAPLVWNSIATGVLPARHRIVGYLRPNGESIVPTSGADRGFASFWQVCSAAGLKTHVVNWPTYPAEPTSGVFVSNLFARFDDDANSPYGSLPRAVSGVDVADRGDLASLRIDPRELGHEELLPFVPHAASVDQGRDPALAILASQLADAASAHAMATALLEDDWQVAAVCYDFLDRLGHSFMRFHPPRSHVTRRSYDLYQGVMNQAYRFMDQMLGRLLQLADDDTHVILFSDHGFRSGNDRPPAQSTGRGDANWHRTLGMLAMRGPAFHADRWVWGGSLLDLCPTLYAIVGLPTHGLDGRPLKDAFKSPPEPGSIEAAQDQLTRREPELNHVESQVIQRYLRDEGYLFKQHFEGPQALVLADDACEFNAAQSCLQFGDVAPALELLLRCHRRRPEVPRFAIAAARCYLALGQHAEARRLVEHALQHGVPKWHGDQLLGQVLRAESDLKGALERLLSSQSQRPQQRGLNAQIGQLYARLGRDEEARRAFNKELELDEDNAAALLGLGKLALTADDDDTALEYLLASAAIQEVSPETHFSLAQAFVKLGRTGEALRALERTLRQYPNHTAAKKLRDSVLSGNRQNRAGDN